MLGWFRNAAAGPVAERVFGGSSLAKPCARDARNRPVDLRAVVARERREDPATRQSPGDRTSR